MSEIVNFCFLSNVPSSVLTLGDTVYSQTTIQHIQYLAMGLYFKIIYFYSTFFYMYSAGVFSKFFLVYSEVVFEYFSRNYKLYQFDFVFKFCFICFILFKILFKIKKTVFKKNVVDTIELGHAGEGGRRVYKITYNGYRVLCCSKPQCNGIAVYGEVRGGTGMFCIEHRVDGMIKVFGCLIDGCKRKLQGKNTCYQHCNTTTG